MAQGDGFKKVVGDKLREEIKWRKDEIAQKTSDLIKGGEDGIRMPSFGDCSGDHLAADVSFVPDYAAGRLDKLAKEIVFLERAIERVNAGTYGICEKCGGNIAVGRLDKEPWAKFCIACASENEAAGKKLCRKGSDPTRPKYALIALRG